MGYGKEEEVGEGISKIEKAKGENEREERRGEGKVEGGTTRKTREQHQSSSIPGSTRQRERMGKQVGGLKTESG